MGFISKMSLSKRLGIIFQLHKSLPLAWKLLMDKRVQLSSKLWFIIPAVLYLILPIDAVVDYIPLLGQLDDLTVLVFLFERFLAKTPNDILNTYLKPTDKI